MEFNFKLGDRPETFSIKNKKILPDSGETKHSLSLIGVTLYLDRIDDRKNRKT
jgi:hypothetical protein